MMIGDIIVLHDGRSGVIVEEVGLLPNEKGYRRYPACIVYKVLIENNIHHVHSGMIRTGKAKQQKPDTTPYTDDELIWKIWGDQ